MADTPTIRVMREQCPTCIFRPGNKMHLLPGRLAGMVRDVKETETAVICHDTYKNLPEGTPVDVMGGPHAVCRGSFDRLETQPIQIAKRLGLVTLVDQ